ncbi:MAG: efflux RND transporter permease subunit [bacterium]|nr:efflux RND transporter permease subunit [bacterium]
MIKLIKFLIHQKLLISLLVVLIMLAGYFTLKSINREAFPEVNFDMVSVTTIYPGGSPDEMEKLISIPIEKKLREVDGIDKVRAYNIENASVVLVYIEDDVKNPAAAVQDIKDAVEQVENLPDKAERPVSKEIKLDKTPVIDVAIYGIGEKVPYKELRKVADELEDFIYKIDGVADVEDKGYYDREYLVEVKPSALRKYRIGMNTVINKLKMRNLDLPGGALRIGDKEFILRTKGQYKNIHEIRNTVIMANDAGVAVRLGAIARISDTFKEADELEYFNGKEAIIFKIWKKRSADEIRLVNKIRDEFKNFKGARLKAEPGEKNKEPENIENKENKSKQNVELAFFNDTSRFTKNNISSVVTNAVTGFILLVAILMLILGYRMAALVTTCIPMSFMVAFVGMKSAAVTLNVVSLFGMIMVLGMIVDFGIVVSENTHRYLEMGYDKLRAIEKGVSEIVWPLTVTLLCICAAFAPLLFLSGLMGKFIIAIPLVLMICLGASWFIAIFVIPTFLNMFSRTRTVEKPPEEAEQDAEHFEKGVWGKIQRRYMGLLEVALKHRYITVLILFMLLVGSMGLASVIDFVFVPGGGSENLLIVTKMPQETNLKANLREIKKVNDIILKLPEGELSALHTSVGIDSSGGFLDPKPGQGTHKATVQIFLTPEKDRERVADTIMAALRSGIEGAQGSGEISRKMKFEFHILESGPPVGKPVNVELRGKDFATLKKIAGEYTGYLETVDGVSDISIDLEEGKQEYRYVINEVMAARTKVSVYDAAMALHASFEGMVATSVREKEDDIDIRVRFPERSRKRLKSLNDVMISTQQGGLIPLSLVTRVEKQPGYSQINRLNYERIVQVQANVDTSKITSMKVNKMLTKKFKNIENEYPGYSIAYGGEQEDTNKSMGELGVLFIFAILVIYIILAVFFDSLALPVVVMVAIPFSLVGVVLALFFHGEPLSFMSVLGLFSLAGVIVSNTLVLVQFINNKRDEGRTLKEALIEGGVIRLRPVILTSGTTVLGLMPTIYAFGDKNYFVAPLAMSFGYGLIFATFITLILIPCFYYIAEDMKGGVARLVGRFGINMRSSIYNPMGNGESKKPVDPVTVTKKKVKAKRKRVKKTEEESSG